MGDNKQATFRTHTTRTNRGKTGTNIYSFFYQLQKDGIVEIQESLCSRRFNACICEFANHIFEDYRKMTTCMTDVIGHDGVFIIAKKDTEEYYKYFSPQELRYDRRIIETIGYNVVNYGESKGKTYDRCLSYSNKPFLQYLKGKKLGAPEKYYVAVTRARYSIAIVVDTLFGAVGFEKCQISMDDDFIEAERYIYNG